MLKKLELRLLGRLELWQEGVPLTQIKAKKSLALLSYLAVTGRSHTRPALTGLLWGGMPEARARDNLSKALSTLRRVVGDHLTITRQTAAIREDSDIWLDVVAFETGANSSSIKRMQKAVQLYQGEFLADFSVLNAAEFEVWVLAQRARLRELMLGALHTLIVYFADKDEAGQTVALDYTNQLLHMEPWREEAHRQMMRLLALSGQRGAALAQFETCRQILDEELGVEPGAETVALYERIRDGQISRRAAEQGREGEFIAAPLHNLPSSPTPLIGREKELADIDALLADPNCRLLTLTGPGGIGKTRLSIEAARQALTRFTDGVYFISLAAVDNVEDIAPRIAAAVDPEPYPTGQTAAEFWPRLQQHDPIRLLVLDNLEQLLPDGCETIDKLLIQTRRLKLIVTSRQALNLRWEWRYDLDGLASPVNNAADNLESYSAIQMFLQRLRQTRRAPLTETTLQAAARICRLVGGMPLGIELAAAQAGRTSCAAIAESLERNLDALLALLRDLPARQRSLRASFEVSWANLSPEEQAVFRRLSLFRSSFSAAAAQAVAEAGASELINLLDKSLLRQASPHRYDIHEVLRHYAQEKLAEVPEEQVQTVTRHRRYYTAFLLERTEALGQGINSTENVAAIVTELDNLLTGWGQIMHQDDPEEFASALVVALNLARQAQLFSSGEFSLFEHHRQLLERRSGEVDVCLIDQIWTNMLAGHLLDLSEAMEDKAQTHFSICVETNTVAGRLVALPFVAGAGLLYYRADLLAKYGFANPPATWDELERMAAEIQAGERAGGRVDFWGFIWQGQNNEGLTCNALEWQASQGGGRLIEPEGMITVNNPQSIAAFERAARWVGAISPASVTEMGLGNEASTLKTWRAGKAAFMRNWTHFFAARSDNSRLEDGAAAVAPLPGGEAGSAATLGSLGIAVSKHARHLREAVELACVVAGKKAQLQRVLSPPFWPPTIPDLYNHPDVAAVQPDLAVIEEIFTSGALVVRPSKICGELYPQVSKVYSTAVHSILTGQVEAATAVAELEARLVEITEFRVGKPLG